MIVPSNDSQIRSNRTSAKTRDKLRVVLVNMPFASLRWPAFGLSQLVPVIKERFGSSVDIEINYLNHDIGQWMGVSLYQEIAERIEHHATGVGEWFFRHIAFPDLADNPSEYFQRYYRAPRLAEFRRAIEELRPGLQPLVLELVDRYALDTADVVGFTSMFAQTVPSLAVARILKERAPDLITVMGGANCEIPMGAALAENASNIDFVFSGPALNSFPEFLNRVLEGNVSADEQIPGVLSKDNCRLIAAKDSIGLERHIDEYIEPDFASFVSRFSITTSTSPLEPILFFETSRGCWWGEKSHCTFCGLNGGTMAYRTMAPKNAIKLFENVFKNAPWCRVYFCVDNIMPKAYLQEVFPYLNPPDGVSLFYEVKADLNRSDFDAMARAHVRLIQPGIESLATSTLKLMRKGTSGFQNIQFLKNCAHYEIRPTWNLLMGFPGEEEAVYAKYAADIPLLSHLPPPSGAYPVRFDRYSPYFVRADEYHLRLRPVDHYQLVYPFDDEALEELAYYFDDHNLGNYKLAMSKWIDRLNDLISIWRRRWSESWEGDGSPTARLELVIDETGTWHIGDSRGDLPKEYEITTLAGKLLLQLERPARADDLCRSLSITPKQVQEELSTLTDNGLLFREGDKYLSLAMPRQLPEVDAPVAATSRSIALAQLPLTR